jgi:hypothetical protein
MDNMNPIGNGFNFPHFHPLNFRDYRNYLPTAYDDSLSMQESLLQVLNFCNEIGLLNQNMSDNWNMLLGWIKTNGIDDAVTAQLNAWVVDGTFEKILDKTSLDTIKNNLQSQMDAYTSKTDANIDTRLSTQDTHISDTLGNMMSLIQNLQTGIKGTYPTRSDLTAAYPQGTQGIFVTLDDVQWNYWNAATNAWTAGGLFNAQPLTDDQKDTVRKYVLDFENLIKNGYFVDADLSSLKTNDAIGAKWAYSDGIDWANLIGDRTRGNGNMDAYFSLSKADQRLASIAYESFKFEYDFLSQSILHFDVFMDIVTPVGNYRTILKHNVTNEAGIHHHLSFMTPQVNEVNPQGLEILSVNIGLSPLDDKVNYNIGRCKITQYKLPINLTDDQPLTYQVKKIDNLFPDQKLLTKKTNTFQGNHASWQYDELNGKRFAKFTYNGADGWYDAFSQIIGIDHLPELVAELLNHRHKYGFNVYVKANTDIKLSADFFTSDGNVQRATFAFLHLAAGEETNIEYVMPELSIYNINNVSTITAVDFVISNLSATDMWVNDIRVDTTQSRTEIKDQNLLPESMTEIVSQGYLKNGSGILGGINHSDGYDWRAFTKNQNNVNGNSDITINFGNPSHVDKTATMNWQQWQLHAIVNANKPSLVTLRVDITSVDGKNNISIPLGNKQVLGSIDTDIIATTPIMSNIANIDMNNVANIAFVISTNYPDNLFAFMITALSIKQIANDSNDPDAIYSENAINRYGTSLFFSPDITKQFVYSQNRPALDISTNKAGANTDAAFNQQSDSLMMNNETNLKTVITSYQDAKFTVAVDCFMSDGTAQHTVISTVDLLANIPQVIDATIPSLNNLSNNKATGANVLIQNDMPAESMHYQIADFSFKRSIGSISTKNNISDQLTSIPVVQLYGDVPAAATDTTTNSFTYIDGSLSYKGFTKTSWQGQSSQSLPKKSYKFKPYSDNALKNKLAMQIDPKFAPASDFVLKAFYNDPTLSLDNIGNEIMHDLAASRKTFSPDLNSTAYLGQCYGKPVELYFNDNYQGLYFFRSGAKENTYGVDGKDATKFVIEGESEKGAAMFQAPSVTKWGDGTGDGLDVEFEPNVPKTLTDDQKAKFNAFVKMVNDGDIEKFKANTLQTSVESAIDYIIFYNLMGSVDSSGRNLEWVTWDNGNHFTVVPYDFDQLFFNDYNGIGRADKNVNAFPVVQMRFGTTHNKYFDLIAQAYPQQLNDRYYELRKNIMREDNIIKRFTDYGSHIGIANFNKEQAKWPIAGRLVNYQYLQNIVYDRFKLVDTQFAAFIAPLIKGT